MENKIIELAKKAEEGDVESQKLLAMMYEIGLDREVDHYESFKWWLEAAKQGDGWAMENVAVYFEKGQGVECDLEQAKKWHQCALESRLKLVEDSPLNKRKTDQLLKSKVVLVVDDDEKMTEYVSLVLKDEGYSVVTSRNVHGGLDILSQNHDVSLIITDIMMPGIDGLKFIHSIRSLQNFLTIPILVLSGDTSKSSQQRAQISGIDGWIMKPFDPDLLIDNVESLLSRYLNSKAS